MRGRKLQLNNDVREKAVAKIKNPVPREGTETAKNILAIFVNNECLIIKNPVPREGTETWIITLRHLIPPLVSY